MNTDPYNPPSTHTYPHTHTWFAVLNGQRVFVRVGLGATILQRAPNRRFTRFLPF